MADIQDTLDVIDSADAPIVENQPTEEQVIKTATAEVLKAEEDAKAAKAAAKAKAKEEAGEETEETEEADAEEQPKVEVETKEPKTEETEAAKADKEKAEKEAAETAKATKEKEEKERASKKADVELAERMGKLAVRERRLLADQEKVKTEREQFIKDREEHVKLKEAAALLETNPIKAFKLIGKDFRKAADRAVELVKNPNLSIEDEMEAQRKYFDQRLADERKTREEEVKKSREESMVAAKEQDRLATSAWVEEQIVKGADKYELINARGLHKQLARDVWEHFEKTGEVVTLTDFLASVEEDLEKNELPKLLATAKAKKLLVPKTTAAIVKAKEEAARAAETEDDEKETEDEPHEKTVKRVRKSLTNSVSTQVAPSGKPAPTGNAWADARAEALWQMKQDEAKQARGA